MIYLGDNRHAGTVGICGIDDIIDDGTPVLQIFGRLVDHFLAVGGVGALVRVVADELPIAVIFKWQISTAFISQETTRQILARFPLLFFNLHSKQKWLPDRRQTIIRNGLATSRDVAHKLPRLAQIPRSIQVDMSGAQIRRDAATSQEHGALGVFSNLLGELVEERLVPQPEAVGGVLHGGERAPRLTVVLGSVDGEVDRWWFRRVILPGR